MNFYLLQLVGKWISMLALLVLSLFNYNVENEEYVFTNDSVNKQLNVVANVVKYDTIKKYNSKLPSNITNVISEGKNGMVYTLADGKEIEILKAQNEVLEVGTGLYGNYKGIMTGYGPDCYTCSGRGYVACNTKDKKSFNLKDDGIYYQDDEYGKVRVMAAALSMFPCGTIVEVESKRLGNFTGIVLDTGYDMRKHLEKGIYHFDIAYETEKDEMVAKTTDMSGNVLYKVQRWGW